MSGEPIKPRGDAVSTKAGGAVPQAGASTSEDIAAFVAKARALSPHAPGAKGRLIFALDATLSRQPTWDMACALQADMFRETAALGSLDIRLVYYRGYNECRATGWISDSASLSTLPIWVSPPRQSILLISVASLALSEIHPVARHSFKPR